MAEKVMCVNKIRDSRGNIVCYMVLSERGIGFGLTADQVKEYIRSGKYDFLNLQIDKAGRLVDKAVKQPVKHTATSAEEISKVYKKLRNSNDNIV